ncbi:MAG TPA: hypothetical protein VML55_21175, partial [Planctomycetaceae bacterium]|nr:hypothetical protein [Planctomycetaceae bacterium]
MQRFRFAFLLAAGLGIATALPPAVRAGDYVETFDGDRPSWQVRYSRSQARLLAHVRDRQFARSGSAEHIAVESGRERPTIQLEHALEPSRVFEELALDVAVRSSTGGWTLWLRVTYPRAVDPRTEKPLQAFVRGDIYSDAGQWQTLRATTDARTMRDRLRRLRSELNQPTIDDTHAFVDQVVLTAELPPGRSDVLFDNLRFGPIVAIPRSVTPAAADAARERDPDFPVDFRLRRLRVAGQPFFPRIIARHGEPVEEFRDAAFNVVWVRDFADDEALAELRRHELWAMATPPRIASDGGRVLDASDVSVLPFTERTRPILMFNLGTRVPPEAQGDLLSWVEQIRTADARFERPIMVDVAGDQERDVSRHVRMPGFTRHVLHTTFSLRQYREWLWRKHLLALNGSFVWTWIQTEPTSSVAAIRHAAQRTPAVVEPEQVRLQVYAALAAGCRGLGYWTTTTLDSDAPGARERRLVISQLNLELALLEPWLATGVLRDPVAFDVSPAESPRVGQRGRPSRTAG